MPRDGRTKQGQRPSPFVRHVRRFSRSLLEPYKNEVIRLYIVGSPGSKPLSLRDLRTHFAREHRLDASEKQWKEQLREWKLRKNMNTLVAASIYDQVLRAKREGGRVFFNEEEQNEQDIKDYVRKTSSISSTDQLLKQLPDKAEWPESVVYVPKGCLAPWEMQVESERGPSPGNEDVLPASADAAATVRPRLAEVAPLQSNSLGEAAGALSNQALYRMNEVSFQQAPQMEFFVTQEPDDWSLVMSREHLRTGYNEIQDIAMQNSLEIPTQAYHFHVQQEPQYELLTAEIADFDTIGSLASSTPRQLAFHRPQDESACVSQLKGILNDIFGKFGVWNDSPANTLIRKALEACIWGGHEEGLDGLPRAMFSQRRAGALDEAVHAFIVIQRDMPLDCLPMINLTRFYLEIYGQRSMARQILNRIRSAIAAPSSSSDRVICSVVDFWISLLDWNADVLASWRPPMARAYAVTAQSSGPRSKPALAVLYIRAWIELELDNADEGFAILNEHHFACEHEFGKYHYQTIAWLKHLARALFYQQKLGAANDLLEETVASRAREQYSEDHPLYIDVLYQQGLFKAIAADKNMSPSERPQLWQSGVELLRKVCLWRARVLGIDNPETVLVLKWTARYLRRKGDEHEARGLRDWCEYQIGLPVVSHEAAANGHYLAVAAQY